MAPIQIDPNPADRFQATTPEQAKANTLYGMNAQISLVNASHAADYEAQWKQYAAGRDARPDATNLVEPMPALAEQVVIDERGWPYIQPGNVYVTPRHIYMPPVTLPSTGGFRPGAVVIADALAGRPLYTKVTASDKSVWLRVE